MRTGRPQRVDDARGEVALSFELPGAQGDLGGEVLRQLVCRRSREPPSGDDDQHVVSHAFTMPFGIIASRQPKASRRGRGQAQQRPPGADSSCGPPHPRSHGHRVTARVLRHRDRQLEEAEPSAERARCDTGAARAALQTPNHTGQPLFGRPARSEDLSDFREDLETRMLRGQRRRDHKVANLGMALLARQRRLSTERQQPPHHRLPPLKKAVGPTQSREMRGCRSDAERRRTDTPPNASRDIGERRRRSAQLECEVEATPVPCSSAPNCATASSVSKRTTSQRARRRASRPSCCSRS